MSVNQAILDAAIRHAIYSERFGRGLAKRIVALLNEADEDLTDKIEARLSRIADGGDTGPATTKRLTEILESLKTLNGSVYKKLLQTLQSELVDLAGFEIENQQATLAKLVPVNIVATAPTPAFLVTLVTTTPIDGILLKSWVDGMRDGRLLRVEKAVRLGMVQGETPQQIARRIRGTKAKGYRDGLMEISRRSAETLALTANSTIANAARERVYQDNAKLIDKLKWLSTLDSRTSATCQARDGELYDLDKPHPTPPAHPRCRSVMIPVTVPFSKLGVDAKDYTPTQRASMDGQVPGNVTFGDWLKGQPRARVEEVMGKGRAELFLSDKLKFADFFNTDDEYYTLAQLRQRAAP